MLPDAGPPKQRMGTGQYVSGRADVSLRRPGARYPFGEGWSAKPRTLRVSALSPSCETWTTPFHEGLRMLKSFEWLAITNKRNLGNLLSGSRDRPICKFLSDGRTPQPTSEAAADIGFIRCHLHNDYN